MLLLSFRVWWFVTNAGDMIYIYTHLHSTNIVAVVVLTLSRIIKSVVTGQAPVTLELGNTPGKKHKPKVIHAYITADAIHASTRNI